MIIITKNDQNKQKNNYLKIHKITKNVYEITMNDKNVQIFTRVYKISNSSSTNFLNIL